jgi:hypothetical protein
MKGFALIARNDGQERQQIPPYRSTGQAQVKCAMTEQRVIPTEVGGLLHDCHSAAKRNPEPLPDA